MTTPLSSIPAESYSAVAGVGAGLPAGVEPDPDNPPWNVTTAVLTWIGSVVLLIGVSAVSLVFIVLYFYSSKGSLNQEQLRQLLTTDKTAILLQVISVIPAHLLTLGLAWAIVTSFGKRPFWRTLGWKYNHWREPVVWVLLALALLLFGGLLTKYYGGEPTDIDQIINSSTASRFVLAFLATATAPLVEEVIYRGILYSALQRAIGVAWAVVGVTILFASVHYWQYQNNISVLAAIGVLSLTLTLVRAYTKSLLPCFVIHLVFNGLQSLLIILQPYVTKPEAVPTQTSGVVVLLSQLFVA
ncbi:MAG TPA: CPBP family intramembrane glutamic endopeptidase [Pyrinomonadaceae bacterium]|jgi:membrane protease YdiL (CAAX protease family)